MIKKAPVISQTHFKKFIITVSKQLIWFVFSMTKTLVYALSILMHNVMCNSVRISFYYVLKLKYNNSFFSSTFKDARCSESRDTQKAVEMRDAL